MSKSTLNYVSVFLTLLFSNNICALEISDSETDCLFSRQFEIVISPSFGKKYSYNLGVDYKGNTACLFKLVYEGGEVENGKFVSIKIEQAEIFLKQYKEALQVELFDKYSYQIEDGESWIINNYYIQNFTIEISTPEHEAKKRGYSKLLELKEQLEIRTGS